MDGRNTEPTLSDLFGAIWSLKWWLAGWVAVAVGVATIYFFLATPVFKATALMKVVSESDDLSLDSLIPQFGGLAGLAGVGLGRGGDNVEPVAVLKSRSLAEEFIRAENLLPVLFAEFWESESGGWSARLPRGPTMGRAVRRLKESVIHIEEDPVGGLVRIEARWQDPDLAARWANSYVAFANRRLQQRAISDAALRLKYLNEELAKSPDVQLQQAIYRLMQTEINTAMVANVRKDYAFMVLDPAVAPDPDDVDWPRPAPLVAVAIALGLMGGLLSAIAFNKFRLRSASAGADPVAGIG